MLSTTAASGQTCVPSARHDEVDGQHRGACRRGSFGHSRLQSIVGESEGVSTEEVGIRTKNKRVLGKFAVECLFHLGLRDVFSLGCSYNNMSANNRIDTGYTSLFTAGPDFVTHLGPPDSLHSIVGESVGITADVVAAESVEEKDESGEFALERLFHLALSDVLTVRGGDDATGIDGGVDAGVTAASPGGPDFALFIIGLCHFGPPVCLLI